jgi:hypothetical protein
VVNLIEQRKLDGDILKGFHSQARANLGASKVKEHFAVKLGANFAFSQTTKSKDFAVSSKPSFAYKRKISTYHQKLPNLPASLKIHFKF